MWLQEEANSDSMLEMVSLTCFFIAFVIIIRLNGLPGGPCSSVVFQLLRRVRLFEIPWAAAHQACLSFTISQSLLKLMSIESVMPSNYLILCRPLLSRLQSSPASGSFQISHLFASGGQSIGVSASASVFPMNIQD